MRHARTLLRRNGQSFDNVCKVLEDFARNTGDEDEDENVGEDAGEEAGEANTQKVVIAQLINFLRGSTA